MPNDNATRKMFKYAMDLFRDKKYLNAKQAFDDIVDTDEELPSNCLTLSVLYYNLSSAAAERNSKTLRNILDITYDDADFNALQTVFLRKFMTDFKNIMESVFDYKRHEEIYGDIVSWYNDLIGERLKNDKGNLAL